MECVLLTVVQWVQVRGSSLIINVTKVGKLEVNYSLIRMEITFMGARHSRPTLNLKYFSEILSSPSILVTR